MILNAIVAWAIKTDKSLKNPTYTVMFFLAITDVEAILGIVFLPAFLMMADLGSAAEIYFRACAYFNGTGYCSVSFTMVLVAFSRWAFFSKNNAAKKFSSNRNLSILCVGIYIFMHIFYSPFLWYKGAITRLSADDGAYAYTNTSVSRVFQVWDDSCNYILVILQIFFNALSFGIVIKMRKEILTPELRAINTQEIKLLIQCGVDSFVFSLLTILYDYSYYTSDDSLWLSIVLQICYLVNHVDCALLYLCFNKKLRSFIISAVKEKVTKANSTTAVVSIPVQPLKIT